MKEFLTEFTKRFFNLSCEIPFEFKKHTTIRVGGNAILGVYPKNVEELKNVIDFCKFYNKKYIILGNGSNVLASDKYLDCVVIKTEKFDMLNINGYNELIVGSGVSVCKLLNFCIKDNFSGLEFLAGIPASVGGLVYMNGGIQNLCVGDNIISVSALINGKIIEFKKAQCEFLYRDSIFKRNGAIILGAQFKLLRTDSNNVKENIKKYINKRKNQPKLNNFGCVFKNINGVSAGKLIDELNLKGYKVGGAKISEKHANFIINCGNATFDDIKNLINFIKSTAIRNKDIRLHEEVVYIGE